MPPMVLITRPGLFSTTETSLPETSSPPLHQAQATGKRKAGTRSVTQGEPTVIEPQVEEAAGKAVPPGAKGTRKAKKRKTEAQTSAEQKSDAGDVHSSSYVMEPQLGQGASTRALQLALPPFPSTFYTKALVSSSRLGGEKEAELPEGGRISIPIPPVILAQRGKQKMGIPRPQALDLLKNVQAQAIIGPVSSEETEFVIKLGEKAQVPIISYTATSPSLPSSGSPYFIRVTLKDSSQVNAISSIVKEFRWREVILVYVDDVFGKGIIPCLTDALDEINTRVPYRSVIPASAPEDEIVAELKKLMTMQTRVFIVHMGPSLGFRLFAKAKELGMISEGYAWIVTDAMANYLSSTNTSIINAMQGVIGVRPFVPQTQELAKFENRWKSKFQQDNPGILNPQLNVFGLWAYDSAVALAMAVEKSGIVDIGLQKSNDSASNTMELETFGISENGPKLLQALQRTIFTGHFRFVNGQLQLPPYQIVNIINSGFKEIGFWTLQKGLVLPLNSTAESSRLGPITWPGGTTTMPKGWMIPTNGKKLSVGVPVNDGYQEFVKITKDSSTNTTKVSGYCIEIFDAVVASLPYDLQYEYHPFAKTNGEAAGTYDELVYQVHLGKYDAVVGDVTIIANRSNFVDFSLPYTASGVAMLVPVKTNQDSKRWWFLKPLTWHLWITSFFAFIVLGMLIWILEHRINEDFSGTNHGGMVFWFPFSTLVFAQREKIESNLARFVLIIWFLFVLILTQAYAASLTSMLTARQLQPTVTDVSQLINNNEHVGYKKGSFVFGLLKKMGFEESRILPYGSIDDCDQLLANGTISAVFDEVPYINVFLDKYCSKYTMLQPSYRTGGFGFAFPIGSPLVPDISKAVLNVTQGNSSEIKIIQNKLFNQTINCPDSSALIDSSNLDVASFRGLFLIAGIAAFLAFLVYNVMFLHEHWAIVTDRNYSIKTKLSMLACEFDNRDGRSLTFKNLDLSPAENIDREPLFDVEEERSDAIAPNSSNISSSSFHFCPY